MQIEIYERSYFESNTWVLSYVCIEFRESSPTRKKPGKQYI